MWVVLKALGYQSIWDLNISDLKICITPIFKSESFRVKFSNFKFSNQQINKSTNQQINP